MALKIFNINMHHAWGGQPNRVLTESIHLARRGHEVWVSGPRDCELVSRATQAGLKTFDDLELRRGFRPASFMRDRRKLIELFRQEKFDILHTHGSQDTWVVATTLSALESRPGFVRTRHNTFDISGHPLNQWLYHRCIDHAITISPQVNGYLEDKGLMQADEITPIYSAPDPERFDPETKTAADRSEFGFSDSDLVAIMVGRLAPEKGHRFLVDAAAELRERFPQLKFIFAGTGRSRAEIEARIAEKNMQDRIVLAGFRKDVPELLAMSDIFILSPIDGESLGTSILEGFLMRLPAVATDVGGVCESVRDGQTGFLVAPGQSQPLAEAIAKLADDPALRKQFGERGRQMVQEEFTPEQIAIKTEVVYQKAIAAHRA